MKSKERKEYGKSPRIIVLALRGHQHYVLLQPTGKMPLATGEDDGFTVVKARKGNRAHANPTSPQLAKALSPYSTSTASVTTNHEAEQPRRSSRVTKRRDFLVYAKKGENGTERQRANNKAVNGSQNIVRHLSATIEETEAKKAVQEIAEVGNQVVAKRGAQVVRERDIQSSASKHVPNARIVCPRCAKNIPVNKHQFVKGHKCRAPNNDSLLKNQAQNDSRANALFKLKEDMAKVTTAKEGAALFTSFLTTGAENDVGGGRNSEDKEDPEGFKKKLYEAVNFGSVSANGILKPLAKRLTTLKDLEQVEACYPHDQSAQAELEKLRLDNAAKMQDAGKYLGIDERLVRANLKVLRQSPPGASGVTAEEITKLTQDPNCMDAIVHLVQAIVSDTLTDSECEAVNQAKGIPLLKPNGSIRPIAKSEMIIKMAERIVLQAAQATITSALGKLDFGVAQENGVELGIHLARTLLVGNQMHALKLDVKNAFNSTSRLYMANTIQTEAPELLGLFLSCTARGNKVAFECDLRAGTGEDDVLTEADQEGVCERMIKWIIQTCGVKQGSAASPLFFSLTMTRALKEVRLKWKGKVLIVAYLDDIIVFAQVLKHAEMAFHDIKAALALPGLEFNLEKCELHSSCSKGVPTVEELELVQSLGIKNSPMYLEYLGATVSSFESIQDRAARILAPIKKKMETIQHFVDVAMNEAVAKPNSEFEMGNTLFKMLLKSVNALDTFALRVNPTEDTSAICDTLNKMKLDLFLQIALPVNEEERAASPTFAKDVDDLRRMSNEECFVHGQHKLMSTKCDSDLHATMRRIFLPNRVGGGGLQDAWGRSVSGYVASYGKALPSIKEMLAPLDLAMPVMESFIKAQETMEAVRKVNADAEKDNELNELPKIPRRKARWAAEGAQRTLMDEFNNCGVHAVLKCYANSKSCPMEQVARFLSKQQGHYHLFIWANQRFRPNRLSREEHRLGVSELIGRWAMNKSKCSGCGEEHHEGTMRHAMSCNKSGARAIMGKAAKLGVAYGTRRAFNIRVPDLEPWYRAFASPPAQDPKKLSKSYVKKKADLEVSYNGWTHLVDVTATGTFPQNMHERDARRRGFIAERREQNKIRETLGWKAKAKVEFVPFAIDIYGGVAPRAIKFKSDLQNHAKAQNKQEQRIFNAIHPARFWEQVNIQVIKGCFTVCRGSAHGEVM